MSSYVYPVLFSIPGTHQRCFLFRYKKDFATQDRLLQVKTSWDSTWQTAYQYISVGASGDSAADFWKQLMFSIAEHITYEDIVHDALGRHPKQEFLEDALYKGKDPIQALRDEFKEIGLTVTLPWE